MFVSVWLGGSNIFLVNNDCMVQNVVQYLRKKCCITDKKVTLDLADEDGNLQNLMDYNPRFPAARILQPKVTYVPILMEKNEDNTWKPFTPMVKRVLKDADFMRQLKEQYERRELSRTGQRVRLESVQEAEKDVAVPTGKGAGKGALSTPKKGAGGGRSKTTK